MSELMIYDDRDTIIAGLRQQLRESQESLASERSRNGVVDEGVSELRLVLQPLYSAMQHVFGEMDAMGITTQAGTPKQAGQASPVWESWKQKLGGYTAKAIDALLLHGALTQTQLRIHIGCASSSVPAIVSGLNKAGLINKSGGKISLKEL